MTILLADLWRPRSRRCCVYLWSKYCCCRNKHHNPSPIHRWDCNPRLFEFPGYLVLFTFIQDHKLNICLLISDADLLQLKESQGKYAPFLSDMCKFYRDWHVKSDGVHGNFSFYFDAASYGSYIYSQLSKLPWE